MNRWTPHIDNERFVFAMQVLVWLFFMAELLSIPIRDHRYLDAMQSGLMLAVFLIVPSWFIGMVLALAVSIIWWLLLQLEQSR